VAVAQLGLVRHRDVFGDDGTDFCGGDFYIMNASKSEFENFLNKVKSSSRFEYVGGGYFRDKNIPKGIKADTLHGSEILDEFCSELIKQYSPSRTSALEESKRNDV
jgi:hypothetical protein